MPIKLLTFIFSILVAFNATAQSVTGPQHSSAPLNITTEDGTVSTFPYKLLVTDGTLTNNGDGTATLDTGGGGSGNVGIGTVNRFAGYVGVSTLGPFQTVEVNGNVGIGTTNPIWKLEVQQGNTAIGTDGVGTVSVITQSSGLANYIAGGSSAAVTEGTGSASYMLAFEGDTYHGTNTTVANAWGVLGTVDSAAGTITNAEAVGAQVYTEGGDITSAAGVGIGSPVLGVGDVVTNLYGLKVNPQSGATNNWDIYSGNPESDFSPILGSGFDGWFYSSNVLASFNAANPYRNVLSIVSESDTTDDVFGTFFIAASKGTGVANVIGGSSTAANTGSNLITNVIAHQFFNEIDGTGNVTNNIAGYFGDSVNQSSGLAANSWGVKVNDITLATANNYSIQTGLGKVSFGDNVGISTTAPMANLHVWNTANTNMFRVDDNSGAESELAGYTGVNSSTNPIGNLAGTTYQSGQSFTVPSASVIASVAFKLQPNDGSPTGTMTIRIETDSAGFPSGTLADPNLTVAVTPVASAVNTATFSSPGNLSGSTTYWIVKSSTGVQSSGNWWNTEIKSLNPYANGFTAYKPGAGAWTTSGIPNYDEYFSVVGHAVGVDPTPFVINTNGNVGIGSLTPGSKLDVNGLTRQTGFQLSTNPAAGYVLTSNSVGVGTWRPTSTLAGVWNTGPGTTINYTAGNVGIGTSNPIAMLHILEPNTEDGFRVDDQSADPSPFLIKQDGNVGIGTTNPDAALHEYGTDSSIYLNTDSVAMPFNGANAVLEGLRLQNSDATTGSAVGIQFSAGATSAGASYIVGIKEGSSLGAMAFGVRNASSSYAEAIRITSAGNVGVGTFAPKAILHASTNGSGAAALPTSLLFGSTTAGTFVDPVGRNRQKATLVVDGNYADSTGNLLNVTSAAGDGLLFVDQGGNVGIGTVAPRAALAVMSGNVGIGTWKPTTKLEVLTVASGDGLKLVRAGGERSIWVTDDGSGAGNLYLFNGSDTNSVFLTGNGSSFLNGGNVGIGSSNPGTTLDVTGTIRASSGTANQAACWKADKTLGQCTSVVGVGGGCTCS